jgi:starch synthase
MGPLKILYVSPEAVPFAKTGGLADVAGALPAAIAGLGHTVKLMTPLYPQVDRHKFGLGRIASGLKAPIAGRAESFDLYKSDIARHGLEACFIEHDRYFNRPELYRDPATGSDWADNDERFCFFCRAVLEACRNMDFIPDIIHCNDWQSGLIPAFTKVDSGYRDFTAVSTVFSIHNIAYQGNFPPESFYKLGLDKSLFSPGGGFEFWGKISYLKAGIWHTDLLNTVSETYAREIQSSNEYGYGFEGVLKDRSIDLFGILNGIDYSVWDPSLDELIPAKYTPGKPAGKKKCKAALRRKTKLPMVRRDIPIIGLISRLADQKGFDLIEEVAEELMSLDIQIVLLGTGDEKYHKLFSGLRQKYPKKIAALLEFNNEMAHLIEAGSDMFLMPSRFEPCGLGQIIAMRYGSVPVVRATGGLADTVIDFDTGNGTRKGTGFTFNDYTGDAFWGALQRALDAFRDKKAWRGLQERGMKADFSWNASAKKYEELYRKALDFHKS